MNKRLAKKQAKKSAQKQLTNLLITSTKEVQLPGTKKIRYEELDFEKILKHSVYTDPVTHKRSRLSDVLKGVQNYQETISAISLTDVQTRPTDIKLKSHTNSIMDVQLHSNRGSLERETVKRNREPKVSLTDKELFEIKVNTIVELARQYLDVANTIEDTNARETIRNYIVRNMLRTSYGDKKALSEKGLSHNINYYEENYDNFRSSVNKFNLNGTAINFYEIEKVVDEHSTRSMYLPSSKPIDFASENNDVSEFAKFMPSPYIDDYVKMKNEEEEPSRAEQENWLPLATYTTEYDKVFTPNLDDIDNATSSFLELVDSIPDYRYIKVTWDDTAWAKVSGKVILKDFTEIKDKFKSLWFDLISNNNEQEVLKYIQDNWQDIQEDIEGVMEDSYGDEVETCYDELVDILSYDNFDNTSDFKEQVSEMGEIIG